MYSAVQVEAGPLQDTTVCQGDSGGAVVRKTNSEEWSIRAVVSYFSPPNQFDRCDGVTPGRRAHYTDLSHYTDWIQSYIAQTPAQNPSFVKSDRSCVDGILDIGTIDMVGFVGRVAVTAIYKRPTSDPKRISLDLSSEAVCRNDDEFGIATCEVKEPSYLSINIAFDLAQITLCNGG